MERLGEPTVELTDIHLRQFTDILIPYLIRHRLTVQSAAVTLRTGGYGQELVGPFLTVLRLVFLHHVTQVLDDTVEGHEHITRGVYQLLADLHLTEGAVENLSHGLLGDILHRTLQRLVVFLQDSLYLPEEQLVLVFSQGHDGSVVDRYIPVGDHLVHVYLIDIPQSLAYRTGTL